jgi:hypothetical protein
MQQKAFHPPVEPVEIDYIPTAKQAAFHASTAMEGISSDCE